MKSSPPYAIIATGGKQYIVKEGDVIDVELLPVETGSAVEFRDVLFVQGPKGASVGTPAVPGAIVKGQLLGITKGEKIESVKYKQRKRQTRKFGHRQKYSSVKILSIVAQ